MNTTRISVTITTAILLASMAFAQGPSSSELVRTYLMPTRIIATEGDVRDAGRLLGPDGGYGVESKNCGQTRLGNDGCMTMRSTASRPASILLDFGTEIHGGLRIVTADMGKKTVDVHICFGESVSEACSVIDGRNGATNDHAIRDFDSLLPWYGAREFGNTGFRFVRIDLLSNDVDVNIREINAIAVDSDCKQTGTFRCSDDRLGRIWETGRHTVKLNMQDYVWDGIKRDRLVWLGDMGPEVMTICNVYGDVPCVPRSLDWAIQAYPLPRWINDMGTYSLWWILIQNEWLRYTGNLEYFKGRSDYYTGLLRLICSRIDENGRPTIGDFLDWPSYADKSAVNTGIHALTLIALREGEQMCTEVLGDLQTAQVCREGIARLTSASPSVIDAFVSEGIAPDRGGRKQAVALMSLAGMVQDDWAADALLFNRSHGFSTFYGYYMLEALAKAGRYAEAMDLISEYWGAMIDLGATSFWEDFDIDWMANAGRIDELPSEDKVDVHRTYGNYCYQGLRHSLCHGWASGPTAWLSRYVLGLEPADIGQTKVLVNPHLGNLEWAEGSYPTPYGTIWIRVSRDSGGRTVAVVDAPRKIRLVAGKGVKVIKRHMGRDKFQS